MSGSDKYWYKKWWGIFLIIGLTLILSLFAAVGFYFFYAVRHYQTQNALLGYPVAKTEIDFKKILGSGKNYWLGAANPKITIVEFSDFACPHCRASFTTIREISLKYKNYVKIIYRDFPVLTDYSLNLALAARCAGEQGLFWPMHDALFLNQGEIKTEKEISILARRIGVNKTKFKQCFNSKKYLAAINQNLNDARSLGITGTPTWFINGYKIEGDIPYHIFIKIIESLID
jgi:protein-disulfide isomerase